MKGKIYKIIHNQSGNIYIGSTICKLSKRFSQHKNSVDKNNSGFYRFVTNNGGFDNFQIILIKEYEVFDKKNLLAYEQLWINKMETLNGQNTIAFNKIKLFMVEIRKKEIKCEICDKLVRKQHLRRHQRSEKCGRVLPPLKERRKIRVICECGESVIKDSIARHKRTKKHQDKVI